MEHPIIPLIEIKDYLKTHISWVLSCVMAVWDLKIIKATTCILRDLLQCGASYNITYCNQMLPQDSHIAGTYCRWNGLMSNYQKSLLFRHGIPNLYTI